MGPELRMQPKRSGPILDMKGAVARQWIGDGWLGFPLFRTAYCYCWFYMFLIWYKGFIEVAPLYGRLGYAG